MPGSGGCSSLHLGGLPGYSGVMAARDWHPVQLGIFWLSVILFSFSMWLLLALGASALANRYPHQVWGEVIPIVLVFLVSLAVVALGLSVTWIWLDTRQAQSQK